MSEALLVIIFKFSCYFDCELIIHPTYFIQSCLVLHVAAGAGIFSMLYCTQKSLDLPEVPYEGIFHGPALLENSVVRIGVCLLV